MAAAGVNWSDIEALSKSGINFDDITVLSEAGINWSDIETLTEAGINFDDVKVLTETGINYADIEVLTERGINWSDINILSKRGVNWSDLTVFTEAEFSRTDKITHVFDEEQVNFLQGQVIYGIVGHVSLEMTAAVSIYLDDRCSLFTYLIGINSGGNITLNNGYSGLRLQPIDGLQDEAGLT